jgi:hypothetical protein
MPALLTLGIASLVSPGAQAQPLDDRVKVDMPYAVTVGHKTLPPGEYIIQRLPSASASRVLLFYSDGGKKFETSAITIPVMDPDTAEETKIILTRIGDDYYYDKIWVQGKTYGYEIPLPREARQRKNEMMAKVTVGGNESTITARTTSLQQEVVAEAPPAPQPEPAPEIAQAEPVTPPAEVEPLPEAANREEPAPRAEMPRTASQWLALLFAGTTLLGAGLTLRRKA